MTVLVTILVVMLLLYLFVKKYAVKEEDDIDEQISNSIEKAKNLGLSKDVWLLADSFTCSPDGEVYPDSDSVAKEAGFQFIDSHKSVESYIANVLINGNKFKLRVGNQKTLYIQDDTYIYKKIEVLVNEESVLSFQVDEEERYHGGVCDWIPRDTVDGVIFGDWTKDIKQCASKARTVYSRMEEEYKEEKKQSELADQKRRFGIK